MQVGGIVQKNPSLEAVINREQSKRLLEFTPVTSNSINISCTPLTAEQEQRIIEMFKPGAWNA